MLTPIIAICISTVLWRNNSVELIDTCRQTRSRDLNQIARNTAQQSNNGIHMESNHRKLGFRDHMILLHNGLLLLCRYDLVPRYQKVLHGIVNKLKDAEEADTDSSFSHIESEGKLMMEIDNWLHHHDNCFCNGFVGIIVKHSTEFLPTELAISH